LHDDPADGLCGMSPDGRHGELPQAWWARDQRA
jgi:hypothetical protein